MKKKLLSICLASVVAMGAIAASALIFGSNFKANELSGGADDFTLTIRAGDLTEETAYDKANGNKDLVTDSTKEAAEANQNKVNFIFEYAPYYESGGYKYQTLKQSIGKIRNSKESPIRSMKEIDITGYGNLYVEWGWLDETDEIKYYGSKLLNLAYDSSCTFDGYKVNYIQLTAYEYSTPGIEQMVITYDKSCTLAENPNFVDSGLRFRKLGVDEAEVLGFSGASIDPLIIPSSVKGLTVTKIAESAFSDNNDLTSVTIPNTITFIDDSAFYSCDNLATVSFITGGSETLYLGDYPFGGASSITGTFTLPKRAGNGIGQYSLRDMYGVSAFAFDETDPEAEYYCLDGVVYRKNVYGVYLHTYPRGKTDTTFTVPSNVTGFNAYVSFRGNEYIETIIFENDSALDIAEYPLADCANLTSVQFNGSGAVTLDWFVFSCSYGISQLILPANTILESKVFGNIGDTVEHSVNVFFESSDISAWHTSSSGEGPWYTSIGEYVNVYLKSDAEIPAGDLPSHIAGSWHYVGDVPTVW